MKGVSKPGFLVLVPCDDPKKGMYVWGEPRIGNPLLHAGTLWSQPELVSGLRQRFELVLAIKLVINCSCSLLPQEGQMAAPFSCSFNVNANRHSLPHFRHL